MSLDLVPLDLVLLDFEAPDPAVIDCVTTTKAFIP
ncbi:hypothetical protein NYA28ABAC_03001 [Salinicola sp. NYA28a]|jgi:hypothetical protein|tara:strand:+ start:202 stop:306 length:105 start_codon:yes stop_codon:yes gene_type:complete